MEHAVCEPSRSPLSWIDWWWWWGAEQPLRLRLLWIFSATSPDCASEQQVRGTTRPPTNTTPRGSANLMLTGHPEFADSERTTFRLSQTAAANLGAVPPLSCL